MRQARPLRTAAALLAALLGAACGDASGPAGLAPVPEGDLVFQVTADTDGVRPGASFPVTVVRAWRRDLVPAVWEDRALAPLALRPRGVSVRDDGARVEETRRYDAYVFALGDVTVRPPPFAARPKDGGPDRKVAADALRIRVRPEVDPKDPGAPELPGAPLREPFPVGLVAGLAAALAVIALVVARRLRSRRPPPPVPPPPPSPPAPDVAARALARLAALRRAGTPSSATADVAAAAETVRGYVGERLAVPVAERTTPEILRDPRLLAGADAAARDHLARVLLAGDLVKFAEDRPTDAARAAALDAAEAFVRGTAPRAAAEGEAR